MVIVIGVRGGDKMKKRTMLYRIPLWILFTIGILLANSADWFFNEWGEIDFAAVLYQLTTPMQGTDEGIIQNYLVTAVVPTLCEILLMIGLDLFLCDCFTKVKLEFNGRWQKKNFRMFIEEKETKTIIRILYCILGVGLVFILSNDVIRMGIPEYIERITNSSTIFEEAYADPDVIELKFPEEKKNLIWIYTESMEISYASPEFGGVRKENLIPNLLKLAEDNVSFHSNGMKGGLNVASGSSWTTGALVSTTTGVPYLLPIRSNSSDAYQEFLPGITAIGEVLAKEGYSNYFMCGSDIEFGGRYPYFKQHGDYEFYDYERAKQDGIIAQDYHNGFWGMEDILMYPWAQSILTELAAKGEPFNFTMLTVDSHYSQGYICDMCDDAYEEKYANAIACSDRQVVKFIEWIQDQEWYEDTVIVIAGDHPTMNKTFLADIPEGYVRQTYNCFLNSQAPYPDESRMTNRTAYTLDLFPTAIAAMGVEIEGDRLGLGTNLFSSLPTLAEEMGKENFENEIAKYSHYYDENFIQDKE